MSLLSRLIPLSCVLMLGIAAPTPEWLGLARRLTGESDAVRVQSLQKLARIPGLDAALTTALSEPHQRGLALDVILALKRTGTLPALWKTEPQDPTGATLLTALTLDSSEINERLLDVAITSDAALARRLVAIDALGRLGFRWQEKHARVFWKGPAEVQLAWLTALRARIFKTGDPEDLALLAPGIEHREPELRARATHVASELTRAGLRKLVYSLRQCPDAECQRLLGLALAKKPEGARR